MRVFRDTTISGLFLHPMIVTTHEVVFYLILVHYNHTPSRKKLGKASTQIFGKGEGKGESKGIHITILIRYSRHFCRA